MSSMSKEGDEAVVDWIQKRKELGLAELNEAGESASDKFVRKFKENPLVPIGATATTIFLCLGLVALTKRDSQRQQFMMRGRIAAQAFTVLALATGLYLKSSEESEP